MVLISDEGDGMEMTVSVGTALQLEHFRSLNSAGVVPDALGTDVENLEKGNDLPVQIRQGFKVRCCFPDLARPGGLRECLQQG